MKLNQQEFAQLMHVHGGTVSRWKSRGWLVMADGLVDVEPSKERLLEKRGTLGPIDNTAASKRSGWSKSPHCTTRNALAIHREWEARNG
jgi:hypothetical protein